MSVRTFNDMLQLVGEAATSLVYTRNIYDDHDGKIQAGQQRSLPATDELLMTLVKLRHNSPESDLAQRFAVSQSTVSRIFSACRSEYLAITETS